MEPAVRGRTPHRVTIRAQLRDLAAATVVALIVFTGAFAAHRNAGLESAQIYAAQHALTAMTEHDGIDPGATVLAVGTARAARHRFLELREVWGPGEPARIAGGPTGSATDKLMIDFTRQCDRRDTKPSYAAMLPDSGRGIAVACHVTGAEPSWVALTAPATPEPYPWLVVIGVLGLGIVIACAGALGGAPFRGIALFTAAAGLAVPALIWGQTVAAVIIVGLAAALAVAAQHGWTDRVATGFVRHRVALTFLAPTALAMIVLVATPFVIGLVIGFYDHHHGTWTYVGLDNFAEILSGGGHALSDPLNFWFVLGVTVLWTFCNVVFHVLIGVGLALLLSRHWLRGKGVWRMLLILPWAIPNYITALIWNGMFQGEYGAINSLLHAAGLSDVSWFSSWATAFSANVITNTWLGFPFMMVVALGALETIPRELYEAASVDGASAWQRFRHITLPHLRPALGPAVALGSIWTFNMFNVIYLVSAGKPGDSTNILVTDAYRWAFERGERYGMAAAYATLIFLILLLWTVFGTRIVRNKEAYA
jgi:ABC-type sugar transport system permease subunit